MCASDATEILTGDGALVHQLRLHAYRTVMMLPLSCRGMSKTASQPQPSYGAVAEGGCMKSDHNNYTRQSDNGGMIRTIAGGPISSTFQYESENEE